MDLKGPKFIQHDTDPRQGLEMMNHYLNESHNAAKGSLTTRLLVFGIKLKLWTQMFEYFFRVICFQFNSNLTYINGNTKECLYLTC